MQIDFLSEGSCLMPFAVYDERKRHCVEFVCAPRYGWATVEGFAQHGTFGLELESINEDAKTVIYVVIALFDRSLN